MMQTFSLQMSLVSIQCSHHHFTKEQFYPNEAVFKAETTVFSTKLPFSRNCYLLFLSSKVYITFSSLEIHLTDTSSIMGQIHHRCYIICISSGNSKDNYKAVIVREQPMGQNAAKLARMPTVTTDQKLPRS